MKTLIKDRILQTGTALYDMLELRGLLIDMSRKVLIRQDFILFSNKLKRVMSFKDELINSIDALQIN